MRTIAFDIEATDLDGEICQISLLIIEDGAVRGINHYFSVERMESGAQEVHGLSISDLETLSQGEYFEDRAQELLALFNSADMVVGHNVAADEKFLRGEMTRLGLKLKRLNTFCTMNFATGIMNMARKVVTGRPKPPKLAELCEYYGITPEEIMQACSTWFDGALGAHDARYDAAATWLCLKAAVQRGDIRGMNGI